ncbi:hypothetical protein [Dictyobacter kobayashii]|uniref:Uncharacterized protein n=1 Tax=Dictyobacter kobayashii TaxID=2014872 RepID=A0A402AXI4_9CHLR|nr:hypothetical protein [Dictyobacter kobayashii]GCE23779.1 hypothetical protein KDK_75790 [Dictyobacter kobayashii]
MSDEVKVSGPTPVVADEFLKVERRGMEPVPDAERHGSPRELALVWTGAMSNYVSLLTGALVIGAPVAVGLAGDNWDWLIVGWRSWLVRPWRPLFMAL